MSSTGGDEHAVVQYSRWRLLFKEIVRGEKLQKRVTPLWTFSLLTLWVLAIPAVYELLSRPYKGFYSYLLIYFRASTSVFHGKMIIEGFCHFCQDFSFFQKLYLYLLRTSSPILEYISFLQSFKLKMENVGGNWSTIPPVGRHFLTGI